MSNVSHIPLSPRYSLKLNVDAASIDHYDIWDNYKNEYVKKEVKNALFNNGNHEDQLLRVCAILNRDHYIYICELNKYIK